MLFSKPKYGVSELRNDKGYLARIYKAEHELINHVRLLNLNSREKQNQERLVDLEGRGRNKKKGSQKQRLSLSQYYDTVTLDTSFYLNNNHFFEMMHHIRQNNSSFLGKELE